MSTVWKKRESLHNECKRSCSALCNNLSVTKYIEFGNIASAFAYASKSVAVTVTDSAGKHGVFQYELKEYSKPSVESTLFLPIAQATFVTLNLKEHKVVLVICGIFGAVVHSIGANSRRLLGRVPVERQDFIRGVCGVRGILYFGHSSGEIWVSQVTLDGSQSSDDPVLRKDAGLKFHKCPIFDIHQTEDKRLASCDEAGCIATWQLSGGVDANQSPLATSRQFSSPCITVRFMSNGLLAGGYQSGHVRIFNGDTLTLMAEICAHSQPITAMDVAGEQIISAAEDSYVRVWRVHPEITNRTRVTVVQEHYVFAEDQTFVGAAFDSAPATKFFLSMYDNSEIWCYQREDPSK